MIDKVLLLISNMPQYPKNVENLFNEYINDIREWFKYNNKFGLDGHEFESSFYTKVIEKDTLSFFDPNANIEFKTWLEKVLYHHYTDLLRHEFAKKNLPDRDSIDEICSALSQFKSAKTRKKSWNQLELVEGGVWHSGRRSCTSRYCF